MQLQIKADTRQLENALYLLAREARVAPGVVIKEETGLLVRNIMQLTPPKNLAQGRNAVKRDFYRAVGILDKNSFSRAQQNVREPMRELIRRKDNETLQVALNEMDNRGWIVKKFAPTDHTSRRNKYGRVTKKSFVMTTDRPAARRHLRKMQGAVGWTKAGFVAALNAVGKTAPRWIQRHASKAGSVVARFSENPMVSAVAHNIKIPNFQRVVDGAVKNRERITQRKIDRLVAGKAVNLGFVTILERK